MGPLRHKPGFTINDILENQANKLISKDSDLEIDSHFITDSHPHMMVTLPYYNTFVPPIPICQQVNTLHKAGWSDTNSHGIPSSYNSCAEQYCAALERAYPHIPYFYPHTSNYPGLIIPTCVSKRKGGQIRFTTQQTKSLESKFANVKYLSPEDRRLLAVDLKLSDRQVKTWFQNRRAKWRRLCPGYMASDIPTNLSQLLREAKVEQENVSSEQHLLDNDNIENVRASNS